MNHKPPHITEDASSHYTYRVTTKDGGTRLDKFLATQHANISRQRIKALILQGQVVVEGRTIDDASYGVKPGEGICMAIPPVKEIPIVAQSIPLNVLYEDNEIIVINKQAGLVVHPAPGNPDLTLVNALMFHCGKSLSGIGGHRRPGIVHRLDKDTSGIMVAAKNDSAHITLTRDFETRSIERQYIAIVWGSIDKKGEFKGSIGRDPYNRKRLAVVKRGGKSAHTRFQCIRPLGHSASLIKCNLGTGRTHQIRVHLSHAGYPVIGDSLYGGNRKQYTKCITNRIGTPINRQALHAISLGFKHPKTGHPLTFHTELPHDMLKLIDDLEHS